MDQIYRNKTVFLILIISTCIHLATGQYNENIEQIKCCDNDDRNNASGSSTENFDHILNAHLLSPFVLDRLRSSGVFPSSSSSCIRMKLDSMLTASHISSLSALNLESAANQSDDTSITWENYSDQFVLYCNNTSMDFIDGFVSESMSDKFASNSQYNDRPSHLNHNQETFRGIILTNVPLNDGYINNMNNGRRGQLAANGQPIEYISWTKSHLDSGLFSTWMQQITRNQNNLIQVKQLDLSDNHFTNLVWNMFELLPNLNALNLSHNAISNEHALHNLFHRLTQLQHLDLSYNQIMSIVKNRLRESAATSTESSHIVNSNNNDRDQPLSKSGGIFSNMPELRALILSHNQINDLPRNTFAANGLPKLNVLNLAHNQLSVIPFQIFQPLVALQYLDLSSNHLVTFLDNFFIENEALIVLNVRNNTIDKVLANSFYGLHNLIELNLSENHIEHINRNAFDSLDSLQRLNLCMNNLSVLPTTLFHRLHQLKYLNLSRNRFKVLPNGIFATQYALEQLIIDDTSLQKLNNWVSRQPDEVKRDVLIRLRSISIRRNRNLLEIDAITFRSLPAVECLNLTGNSLSGLPQEIGELTELKHLDISKNDLKSIPKQLHTLQQLETISMTGNSYDCDCQMVWLIEWMNETRTRAMNLTLIEQRPPFNQINELKCRHGYPGDFLRVLQHLQCFKPFAVHVSDSKTYLLRGDAQLDCSFDGYPMPDIIWVTPLNRIIPWYADPDAKPLHLTNNQSTINTSQSHGDIQQQTNKNREKIEHQILHHKNINFTLPIGANEVTLLENGSLRVHNISRKDSGLYICYGYNVMGYASAEIR